MTGRNIFSGGDNPRKVFSGEQENRGLFSGNGDQKIPHDY